MPFKKMSFQDRTLESRKNLNSGMIFSGIFINLTCMQCSLQDFFKE